MISRRSGRDGTGRVALFPGAGSFGGEFQVLVEAVTPEPWLVKYPGRHGRDFGVAAESFGAVVQACVEQIGDSPAAPPILVGHSLGAYVAYATAWALQQAGSTVSALVVIGAPAPGQIEVSQQAISSPAEAARYLDRIDPRVLAAAPSDDWREIVVETVMQDLRLLRQFDVPTPATLRCPIIAVRGDRDPLTPEAGLAGWRDRTTDNFSTRVFRGGHSDFLRSTVCASWFRRVHSDLQG